MPIFGILCGVHAHLSELGTRRIEGRCWTLIERYIAYRQMLGELFKTNASILRAFGRAIGASATVTKVRQAQVEAFLAGVGPVTTARDTFWDTFSRVAPLVFSFRFPRRHLLRNLESS